MTNRVFQRPTLNLTTKPLSTSLGHSRPFQVDLERFFEFSFDLAEDLLDLELKYSAGAKPLQRLPMAMRQDSSETDSPKYFGPNHEFDFDIDASWM